MLRTLFIAAALVFAVAVTAASFLMGGCGKKSPARPVPAATGEPTPAPTVRAEIGRDPSRIGRLEREAIVHATVFHAEHGASGPETVRIAPGTWLLPAGALPEPGGE